MRAGVVGVEAQGLIQQVQGFVGVGRRVRIGERQRLQKEVICVEAAGPLAARPLDLGASQRGFERADDAFGQTILQVENVLGSALEFVRPDMGRILALDKLGRDPKPVRGPANASFQHVADPKLRGDPSYIERLALVGKARVACDGEETRDLRQACNEVFHEPVGKIVLLGAPAHIRERQHRERRLAGHRERPRLQHSGHQTVPDDATIRYRMLSRAANASVRSGQRAAQPNLPRLRTLPMSIPAAAPRIYLNAGAVERP